MRDAFRVGTENLKSTSGFSLFNTYNSWGLKIVKVPTMVFHFKYCADVSLSTTNYLILVDSASSVLCFAFAGNIGGISIIGNIQQQGLHVVFDSLTNHVGFKTGSFLA